MSFRQEDDATAGAGAWKWNWNWKFLGIRTRELCNGSLCLSKSGEVARIQVIKVSRRYRLLSGLVRQRTGTGQVSYEKIPHKTRIIVSVASDDKVFSNGDRWVGSDGVA